MNQDLPVRQVDLPAMTVASAHGFGKEPEYEAAVLLTAFAAKIGVKLGTEGHEGYGFNNPNPSPGSDNYGYELWMRVAPGTQAIPPIEIKEVPARSYVVTACHGLSNIGETWKQLAAWYENSPYAQLPPCGLPCWLESLQTPDESDPEKWILDLYLAITPSNDR